MDEIRSNNAETVSDSSNPEVHHEESDVNVRAIFAFAIGMVIAAVVIHTSMWGLFRFFAWQTDPARQEKAPTTLIQSPTRRMPPEPRLQASPSDDMTRLRQSETRSLDGYGWVDQKSGTARIPIERAMAMVAQKGLPVRTGQPAAVTSTSGVVVTPNIATTAPATTVRPVVAPPHAAAPGAHAP